MGDCTCENKYVEKGICVIFASNIAPPGVFQARINQRSALKSMITLLFLHFP